MTEPAIQIIAKAIYNDRNGAGAKPWARRPQAHKDPYLSDAIAALKALRAAGYWVARWEPIDAAPRDGTIMDVWLGDADPNDVDFYCTPGTRRSCGWRWNQGKFRPFGGLSVTLATFAQPTHFMHLPPPPSAGSEDGGDDARFV